MKDPDGSTDAGAKRDSDSVNTDPALSSHTFMGSADRVVLRITPARGDAPPGSVEIIDAASLPVGTTAPPAEIVVRQLYPDTEVPATITRAAPSHTLPLPPGPPPLADMQRRTPGGSGGNSVFSRRVWFGIAAIIVVLLAIGFLVLRSLGRTADAVPPSASAPALVGVPTIPAVPLAPTLAPPLVPPSPAPTVVPPTSIPSTPRTPTEAPLPTAVPAATLAPAAISTMAPITVPIPVPTAVPPTSVPNAPPPQPAVAPAAPPPQGANPAATVPLPAIPPLPPGISLPPANIPSASQIPRKPPLP